MTRSIETKLARSAWGMQRTLVANLVKGVTEGLHASRWKSTASVIAPRLQGKNLKLNLGYSHDVDYPIPTGIEIKTPKPTEIVITGIDKQQVGQVAAEIRDGASRNPTRARASSTRRKDLPQGREEEVRDKHHGESHSSRSAQGPRPQGACRSASMAVPACRCTGRRRTSMPRSSTTRRV